VGLFRVYGPGAGGEERERFVAESNLVVTRHQPTHLTAPHRIASTTPVSHSERYEVIAATSAVREYTEALRQALAAVTRSGRLRALLLAVSARFGCVGWGGEGGGGSLSAEVFAGVCVKLLHRRSTERVHPCVNPTTHQVRDVANIMNAHRAGGKVQGFRLASLRRLRDTR